MFQKCFLQNIKKLKNIKINFFDFSLDVKETAVNIKIFTKSVYAY